MSRSYKKHGHCNIAGRDNSYKKIYNRHLRRTDAYKDMDNRPGSYKKRHESWNIDDWSNNCTFEQFTNNRFCIELCEKKSDKECKRCYDRCYKDK